MESWGMLEEVSQPVKALTSEPDLISVPGSHTSGETNSWELSYNIIDRPWCVCVCVCTCTHTTVQWHSGLTLSLLSFRTCLLLGT